MTLSVRDYDTALKAYAMDTADRKGASPTDLAVLQLNEDPNNLMLLCAVVDAARATAFFDSPALAAHIVKNAGVIGPRERHFWKPGRTPRPELPDKKLALPGGRTADIRDRTMRVISLANNVTPDCTCGTDLE